MHSIKHPLWKKETVEACYVFTLYCCVQVCHFVDSLLVIGPLVLFALQEEFKSMIEDAGFYCVQYYNFTGGVVALHSGFKLWDALWMPSVKYRRSKKSFSGFSAVWLYRFFRLEFSSSRLQSAFHLLIAEWPKVIKSRGIITKTLNRPHCMCTCTNEKMIFIFFW